MKQGLLSIAFSICAFFWLTVSCAPRSSAPAKVPQAAASASETLTKDGCSLRYTLPPQETPLNDAFTITIDVSAPGLAGTDVSTKGLEESFQVDVRKDPVEIPGEGRNAEQHLRVTLEALWHGDSVTIQEILVSCTFADNRAPVLFAIPSAVIKVLEPTEEERTLPLMDEMARTPLTEPNIIRDNWRWITAIAIILAVLLFSWILLRKRGKNSPDRIAKLEEIIPPDVRALRLLDALIAKDLVNRGEIKQFYDRISEILRDYIEGRYGLHAPERTTEEFLEELRVKPGVFSKQHLLLLNAFMKHTDLVKFARVIPADEEISQTVADTRSFIRETTPATPEEVPAP